MQKVYAVLESGLPARATKLTKEEEIFVDSLYLLTKKKTIYCANIEEGGDENNSLVQKVRAYASKEGSEVIALSAQLESELASLPPEDKAIFMEEMGVSESGLDKLVTSSYRLLGLMSYLTAGEKETRAWTIPVGFKAPQAAGKIHTDFERGFIRAEVINHKVLMECGGYTAAKEKGKLRSEGKEYVVQEGDVILFRFNV